MAAYDLYGFLSNDINNARNLLETALGVKFEVQSSSYQGGEYFRWGKTSDEHFVLKRNFDPYDDEPAEISFPFHPLLLYINDTQRSKDLQYQLDQKAERFSLLRHEEL